MPEWAKSFTSLVAHLVPMIGSMVVMDPIKVPKQLKSTVALGLMYMGVWGDSKLESYPKVAGITIGSSLFSDLTGLPNFARRSLLAFFLSSYQHLSQVSIGKLTSNDMVDLFKKFIPKLLEMELKINAAVPASDMVSKQSSNKLIGAGLQVLSISGIVTTITEILKAAGLRTNDAHSDSTALGDMCPVCGEAHAAGECVAADIAPTLTASTAV